MAWTERQHGLLQAMGLRLWSPPVRDGAGDAATASPAATSAAAAAAVVAVIAAPAVVAPVALPVVAPRAGTVSLVVRAPAAPAPDAPCSKADTAGLDWPALRSAVSECRACSLCDSRSQTVFGVGHPQAHWLVVGEAPGEQEDLLGEPFVGPAGRLLDGMLAALRLTRAEDGDAAPGRRAFIANTLKCRPPRNRNPTPEELAQCEPFLVRQIQLLQPRIILAMGRFAVHSLLRSDEPIGKLRGRVHQYQGVPLVVTYHPAYLLRNLPDKAKAWEDLCLAAEVAERAAAVHP